MISCKECDHILIMRCPICRGVLGVRDQNARIEDIKKQIIEALMTIPANKISERLDQVFSEFKKGG